MPARPSLPALSFCAALALATLATGCVQPEGGGLDFASRCGVRVPDGERRFPLADGRSVRAVQDGCVTYVEFLSAEGRPLRNIRVNGVFLTSDIEPQWRTLLGQTRDARLREIAGLTYVEGGGSRGGRGRD
ncbi:MAG: hypothetical protein IT557_05395 [Alphaproteobacteria bacterium]|nr:hypothetical protein [Alphaproteobacteria bacterium]